VQHTNRNRNSGRVGRGIRGIRSASDEQIEVDVVVVLGRTDSLLVNGHGKVPVLRPETTGGETWRWRGTVARLTEREGGDRRTRGDQSLRRIINQDRRKIKELRSGRESFGIYSRAHVVSSVSSFGKARLGAAGEKRMRMDDGSDLRAGFDKDRGRMVVERHFD
jgi:hypothetical protein